MQKEKGFKQLSQRFPPQVTVSNFKHTIYCHCGKLLFQGLQRHVQFIHLSSHVVAPHFQLDAKETHEKAKEAKWKKINKWQSVFLCSLLHATFNCIFEAVKLNLFNGLRHLSLATTTATATRATLINIGHVAYAQYKIRY